MSTISKAECKCIISSFILIFPFLFAQFLSGLFLFFCGILLIVIFWTSFKGYKTMLEILALLGCVVIPISFVSVFGSNYGLFPVSWFNIIIVLLSFLLLNRNLSKSKALFLLSFIFFLVVEVFFNFNAIDSIKQAINLVVFILAFPIGKMLRQKGILNGTLIRFYVVGVFVYATMILFQYFYIKHSGNVIGKFDIFGGNRYSYAALFSDYSFASLYLCSGIAFVVVQFLRERKGHLFFRVFEILTMFSAMLLTSARTGMVALAVALLIYIIAKIIHKKSFYYLLLVFSCVVLPFALMIMMRGRPEESLFSFSGRLGTYAAGIQAFSDSPIFGMGLGITSFSNQFGVEIPHNFFIQYLAQIGIVGLTFLLIYLFNIFRGIRVGHDVFLPLLLVLIGSMAIPDICNSRYFVVIIMIASCKDIQLEGVVS